MIYHFSTIKNWFLPVLVLNTMAVPAITFDTFVLKDTSMSNYTGFTDKNSQRNDKYQKIIADFNGDGFNDIVSLGGDIPCMTCSPKPPPVPVEILLYENGEFVYHEIETIFSNSSHTSISAKTTDIDLDGDQDIVFSNGKIAINDGAANFTEMRFYAGQITDIFYLVDWNNDNTIDIVSQDNIFINDGNLNFTQITNSIANGKRMIVTDLDNDFDNDMLVINDNQVESWLQDSNGDFELQASISINNIRFIQSIDVNSDGASDFVVTFENESTPVIKLFVNNGQGQFTSSDFSFSQFNNVPFDSIEISKIFVEDGDGDGDNELWINATFTSALMQCENKQNLLMLYENINGGEIQFKRSIHTTGYLGNYSLYGEVDSENFPTLIDLNNDQLLDVVTPGDSPVAWIQSEQYYFNLSNISSLQFNNHTEVLDFDGDGNADILSSGKYSGNCQVLPPTDDTISITSSYSGAGKLWLGDGSGTFKPYFSGIAGFENFNAPVDYSKLIDVFQDGNYLAVSTRPALDGQQRQSTIAYPRLADPGIWDDLPEPTKLIETADLTNNGKLEIVMLADTDEAPIYVLTVPSNAPLPSQVMAKLDFGFKNGEIKLADMDNDGFIDIIANSKAQTDSINIWYNNGDNTFSKGGSFGNDVKSIAVYDFDGDGKKDIFASNLNHDMWINQGGRVFQNTDYDKSFWQLLISTNPNQSIDLVPEKITMKDIDGDGLDDMVVYIQNNIHVYLNDSKNSISFYNNYTSPAFLPHNPSHIEDSNIAYADVNNDGRMDFISGSDGFIKIHIQKDENIRSGLYYDPNFNGHGFSVEELGQKGLYYTVLYTYDDFGKPDWYSMLNRYESNENIWELKRLENNNNIHFLYDYDTQSTRIDSSFENLGYFEFYNDKEISQLDYALIRIAETPVSWQLNEIVNINMQPENDLSGIWWAGPDDAGWGLSLSFIQRENTQEIVVVLYFYDEFGSPRWLIGQSTGFELNQDIAINMKQINGYGRFQNYVELTEVESGSITLNLTKASSEGIESGILSMDVFYPGDSVNDNWKRNDLPIYLFSKPRN